MCAQDVITTSCSIVNIVLGPIWPFNEHENHQFDNEQNIHTSSIDDEERDNKPCNIAQLLGCILWDHVSHDHNYPLIMGFLVCGEHSGCVMRILWQVYAISIYIFFK